MGTRRDRTLSWGRVRDVDYGAFRAVMDKLGSRIDEGKKAVSA